MPVPEEQICTYQEAERFLSRSYTLKNFSKEYKKSYQGKAKSKCLFLLVLSQLEKAILEGNVTNFKHLTRLIDYIGDIENRTTLKAYCGHTENFLNRTNLVMLACKHNRVEILRHIFSNRKLLDCLSIKADKNSVSPYEKDDTGHNAFYYAVRSGNVQLLDILISKWPGDYFTVHLEELDELLATAYEELKLKNVPLSKGIEIFVENKLLSLRFFSYSSGQVRNNAKDCLNNIKERVHLVLENIAVLKSEYSNKKKVGEKFLFVARFIAHNIHVLKRQLKFTYDRLPWEEIEFCLICFVSSYMKHQEINLFYRTILSKSKMIVYLDNFAKKLEYCKAIIEKVDVWNLAEFPNLKRDQVVAEIIQKSPEFEELYSDYQQIRDVCSLRTINGHLNLALCADPEKREGQLIITRALQVIAEYLKNTLESPKLSNMTAERILSSLSQITIKVIIDLRHSLSPSSLFERIEIEKNSNGSLFVGVQNDAKRIHDVITDILYFNKIKMIKTLLNRIVHSEHLDEIESVGEVLRNVELEETTPAGFKKIEYENLENLFQKLSEAIPKKTKYEDELFNKINDKMNLIKASFIDTTPDHTVVFSLLKILNICINENYLDDNSVKAMKLTANETLESIGSEMESSSLKEIVELSTKIFLSVCSRMEGEDLENVRRIQGEFLYVCEFRFSHILSIEKSKEKLHDKRSIFQISKEKKIDDVTEEECNKLLVSRLSELKNILRSNASSGELMEKLPSLKSNKKFQAVVEMFVLDIMSILGRSGRRLENNLLFLDESSPLLTGKCLRNHLAHGNDLLEVLLSDPSIAVILNAEKLISENIINSQRKVGKFVRDDPLKLKKRYERNLIAIINQKMMFTALKKGNFDDFKNYLYEGADINARSINLWTSLHFAAAGPSIEAVKFILAQNSGLTPDVKNANGQTPLYIAAACGRKDIVQFFITKLRAKVSGADNCGSTPLHVAAKNGHKDTVSVLLRFNAATNCKDDRQFLPLHYAILSNRVDITKILLEKEPHADYTEIKGGFTLLHIAAKFNSLEVVEHLLDIGANVNAKHDKGGIPLHEAVRHGNLETAKILILKGSDVNAQVWDGSSPLHDATLNCDKEMVDLLLKHGANVNITDKTVHYTPLHHAAKYGHHEIVELLLKYKANPNVVVTIGFTPLHLAVKHGHLKIVAHLIEYGANINAKETSKFTPLHYAVDTGHKEIAELLIANKAEVNARSNNDLTPLHVAALNGYVDLVDLLIKNKAGVNHRATNGSTPLCTAAQNGNVDVIKLLLRNNARVDVKTNDGMTPLHIAALQGNSDVIIVLLKHGVDVNCKNNDGFTPLHVAVQQGHKDVVKLLLNCNIDIHAASFSCGKPSRALSITVTPLALAVDAGHKDIVEVLLANKANVNARSFGETPLISAVRYNRKDIVKILVSNGADINVDKGQPLSIAVQSGFSDIVEVLLRDGARVNMRINDDNDTILHLAAERGIKEIAAALIKKGADVNAMNVENKSPLYIAAQEGHNEVAEVLIANKANVNIVNTHGTALHMAAKCGNHVVADTLLKNGAKIDIVDSWSRTPMEIAVVHDHLRVAEVLLQCGKVDVNAKNINDLTLLHIASQKGNLEMVKYLVSRGYDINARNDHGLKPIHVAAARGDKNMVEFFLIKGLHVDEPSSAAFTLLHHAVMEDQLEVVKFLIEQGANVNARSEHGFTPMHFAAAFGLMDVIKILLDNGAVYNPLDNYSRRPLDMVDDESNKLTRGFFNQPLKSVRNKDVYNALLSTRDLFLAVKRNCSSDVENYIKLGAFVNAKSANTETTPLHYAAWKGLDKIVKVLMQYNANPNAICSQGFTPLHYAARFSRFECTKILLHHGAIYNAVSNSGKTPLNFTVDQNVFNLLKLIDESFNKIENNDSVIISDISKIGDSDTLKAVMNARNRENKPLIAIASPSVAKQLKEMQLGDVSAEIEEALVFFSCGYLQQGHDVLKCLYEKSERILGPDNPCTLDIRKSVVHGLFLQDNQQDSLEVLEEILAKQNESLGSNHRSTLDTRCSIALMLYRRGQLEQALDIFQEIYEKQKKLFGLNHTETLVIRFHIAMVLEKMERNEEALDIYREADEKKSEIFGENSIFTLIAENNMAVLLRKLGKHEECLKIYKELFEKKKRLLGIGHPDTVGTLKCVADTLCNLEKYPESQATYRDVLDILYKSLPPNHSEILSNQHKLANVIFAQGKLIGALKIYNEYFDQLEDECGPDHPIVLDILEKMKIIKLKFNLGGSSTSELLLHLQNDINVAAGNGDLRTIDRLLRSGANVNDEDAEGKTPLYYAVSSGRADVINNLLMNKADVTQVTHNGETLLHVAASKGQKDIIERLLGQVECDKLNDFVNAKTVSDGTTSLHVAAKSGFLEIAKSLLQYGAIYSVTNDEGKTPIDLSTDQKIFDFLKLIDEFFEDAKKGNAEIINKLKAVKSDEFLAVTNARNNENRGLLQVAIVNKHKIIANKLLKMLQKT